MEEIMLEESESVASYSDNYNTTESITSDNSAGIVPDVAVESETASETEVGFANESESLETELQSELVSETEIETEILENESEIESETSNENYTEILVSIDGHLQNVENVCISGVAFLGLILGVLLSHSFGRFL